jgi:hypothetical protein
MENVSISNTNEGATGAKHSDLADQGSLAASANTEQAKIPRGKKGKYQGQTGPRSQKGKQISRKNCTMIHGLRAKKLLMPFEDPSEYEAHLAAMARALKPQDAVERGIVDAYAYALWTSPRFESHQQARARQQLEEKLRYSGPAEIAKSLGLSRTHQEHAPDYLVDLDYEISTERTQGAQGLLAHYHIILASVGDDDANSIDWSIAITEYRQLFDALDRWVRARGDEIAVYADDGKTLHPHLLEHPEALWDDLQAYACFLYFEANFMSLKPQITIAIEQVYWKTCHLPYAGFSDHFVKSQNFAFAQLERLAAFRKMKKKFISPKEQSIEGEE